MGRKSNGYRLEVIGIAAKNFDASQDFYQKKLGLRVGFTINDDPKHPYLQLSRNTFLELAAAPANGAPTFTHVHLVVDDLNATLDRRQNGMPITANDARTPGSVTGLTFSAPSQVYAAYVSDPDNIRLELNQWVYSLPKRAAPGSNLVRRRHAAVNGPPLQHPLSYWAEPQLRPQCRSLETKSL